MRRELLGGEIQQKSKSEYFSITDLFIITNKWRMSNGMDSKTMQDYLQVKSHKEFIAELDTKFKKKVLIIGNGRGKHTWWHPLVFIDMALWLNPKLKIEVYEWLFDNLLKYRNDSGDSFKRMCGALFVRANKTDFVKNIQKLCKLIQVECGVTDWQCANQEQLALRDRIQENIALLADVLSDNRESIRLGILKAKETLKKD